MQKFQTITSIVAYLPLSNVDTDMIIPKQFLKTIKRTGLGKHLFADLRYHLDGTPNPEFILNQSPYNQAQILLAEENFGCGSSREHAPWSLLDFGIKVIIAPSFADIFYANSFNNGLLLIVLDKAAITRLATSNSPVIVDLEQQKVVSNEGVFHFPMETYLKEKLLHGLDAIGETLLFAEEIALFEAKQKKNQPWLYPCHE